MEIQPLFYTNLTIDCINTIYKHLILLNSINIYLKSDVINYSIIIHIISKIDDDNNLRHLKTFVIKFRLKLIKFLRNKISLYEYYYLLYTEHKNLSIIKLILLRYSKFFDFEEIVYGLSILKVMLDKKESLDIL